MTRPAILQRNKRPQTLAAGLALAIAMTVLVSLEYIGERRGLLRSLEAQARVVGESSIPALVFDDPGAAASTLASLGALSTVRGAALYRIEDGGPVLFAAHHASGSAGARLDFPAHGLPEYFFPILAIDQPLHVDGELIGFVYVVAAGGELFHRVGQYLLTVVLVASGALALAYLLTAHLRRHVAETERLLERRAHYDELTGLPNRNLFQDRMSHAIAHAQREQKVLALLFCDLDNFKVINDSLGHATGDTLLQHVGVRLREATRHSDTICRIGGDEFVAILEGCDATGAARVAVDLIAELSAPYQVHERTLAIGASVGIALYPDDGADAGQLLRAADTALYAAKSSGRNTYHFFSHALDTRAHERMELEGGLRHALARGELHLHYQPQVNALDRRVIGAEALLRWRSAEFGDIAPLRFIPIAEEAGLIGEIGAWVLDEAARQAGEWLPRSPAFVMAVNLSTRQLNDPTLVSTVAETLARYRIPAAQLELEITESALLKRTDTVNANLQGLDALGVRLALDDFGTGYSSLGYLKHLPIDRLKIDRGFVQQLPEDADDAAIVEAILALAAAMDMAVVAEGVESEAQLACLRSAGCTVAQGWLFGRPLPPDQFAARFLDAPARVPG